MAVSTPPRDLPQVPDTVDPAIRRPLSRVIEEVQRLLEFRGDPMDAALTLRKAYARGLVDSMGRALTGNVTYVNTFPTTGGGGGDAPDLTPPPTVTGLIVTAGFTQVLVEFDAPTYSQGHGNLQTNIYASKKATTDATLPVFDDAVLVFSAPGALNVVSIPSELNTRWHVWAKYKTVDGVESTTAAGGPNGFNVAGVYPTTGQDIAQLLDVLTGQITESQLFSALGTRINLIDASDAVAGSVNARVKTETDARAAAITLARSDFAAADAATLTSANSYVTTYAYSKSTVDGALSALDTTLRAAFASADATTLASANAFTYARSTIDSAIASSASSVSAAFAAADATTLASANAFTYSRSSIDSAIASSATTLTAAYTAADATASAATLSAADAAAAARDATVLASANSYTYSQATIDGAIASSASTLTASYGSAISAAVGTEASARAALDGAVQALYTVRTEVSSGGRTVVGGFGLAATATASAGPRLDFGVRADLFYVAAPAGTGLSDAFPFIIRTTGTTENGVSIPSGVFMDSAYIVNLSAMWARFGTLIADSIAAGQISAANLTLGDGTVGGDLKSTSFTAGSGVTPGTGWKLTPGGVLYASNAVIYGTVYATSGVFSGSLSGATITGATGTFTGSLSGADITGATGTFSGSLNVNSGGSSRLEMTTSRIKIFNAGVERIRIGDLS